MTDRRVIDLLSMAKQLLEDPLRWTRGTMARDAEGLSVSASNKNAVRWCAVGALACAAARLKVSGATYLSAYLFLSQTCDGSHIGVFSVNDEKGHAAVLTMYDEAMSLVEKELFEGGVK